MKIGSLCTGYGGLDMAVEAYFNAETVWCFENDPYASSLIQRRYGVENFNDVTEVDMLQLPPVDIITAGYPCQPFSTSGSRKGTDDYRHLWPYIYAIIIQLRPQIIVLENVRGHLSLGFKEVLGDLARIGYDCEWQLVQAADVGAPHERSRLFAIAYPHGRRWGVPSSIEKTSNTTSQGSQGCEHSRGRFKCSGCTADLAVPDILDSKGRLNPVFVEYMMGLPTGWVTDCDLSRSQQLKILGNGVVPQQAYHAISLMMDTVNNL
jgi:DNA (cytosine-5)-methyltransferase 1